MVKVGSGRGAFMFCPQCEEGICGRCAVDLGMTAGCPQCRTELVYMDGADNDIHVFHHLSSPTSHAA